MAKKKSKKTPDNVLAQNRKARHDYTVLETVEAGIALTGTEIKSVRERRVNLQDGFAQIRNNEAWLTLVSMFKETDLTMIHCVTVSSCCIKKRFGG